MPNEDNKILKYNHGEKSMKAPFIIYADLESLLEEMNTCYDSPEKSSTNKINKHTPSGYSLLTHCSFDITKNKLDYYRGENCMKKFCLDLREHATKIINYKMKEMIPLTKKEQKNHNKQKIFVIYAEKNLIQMTAIKSKVIKSKIIVIIQENIEMLLMIFVT